VVRFVLGPAAVGQLAFAPHRREHATGCDGLDRAVNGRGSSGQNLDGTRIKAELEWDLHPILPTNVAANESRVY
jgi:hypothetical protein